MVTLTLMLGIKPFFVCKNIAYQFLLKIDHTFFFWCIVTFRCKVQSNHGCSYGSSIFASLQMADQRILLPVVFYILFWVLNLLANRAASSIATTTAFAYQLKSAIDLILREAVVDNVKEANSLASVEDLLSNMFGVLVELSKVNDRNFVNHGGNKRQKPLIRLFPNLSLPSRSMRAVRLSSFLVFKPTWVVLNLLLSLSSVGNPFGEGVN